MLLVCILYWLPCLLYSSPSEDHISHQPRGLFRNTLGPSLPPSLGDTVSFCFFFNNAWLTLLWINSSSRSFRDIHGSLIITLQREHAELFHFFSLWFEKWREKSLRCSDWQRERKRLRWIVFFKWLKTEGVWEETAWCWRNKPNSTLSVRLIDKTWWTLII